MKHIETIKTAMLALILVTLCGNAWLMVLVVDALKTTNFELYEMRSEVTWLGDDVESIKFDVKD